MSQPTPWRVEYIEAVADWVRGLSEKDRARVLRTVGLLQTYGAQLGTQHSRHLGGKLFELRIVSGKSDFRMLYFPHSGRLFVFVHAFAKKTQKTPSREIATAERRMAEVLGSQGVHKE